MGKKHTLTGISGIYAIINLINNKIYVGKSINIGRRWSAHKVGLVRQSTDYNRYLINSVAKYGMRNFTIEILEEIDINLGEEYFKERELFWMDYLNSCDRSCGYNLRRDSSTKMIVHENTRKLLSQKYQGENNPNYGKKWSIERKEKMSKLKKECGYRPSLEDIMKGIHNKNKKWEENPQLKKDMGIKVSNAKSKYDLLQVDRNSGEILQVFSTFIDLKNTYTDVGKTVIYSVCNGSKKSYKGYYWRYRCKKTGEIIKTKYDL